MAKLRNHHPCWLQCMHVFICMYLSQRQQVSHPVTDVVIEYQVSSRQLQRFLSYFRKTGGGQKEAYIFCLFTSEINIDGRKQLLPSPPFQLLPQYFKWCAGEMSNLKHLITMLPNRSEGLVTGNVTGSTSVKVQSFFLTMKRYFATILGEWGVVQQSNVVMCITPLLR